MAAVRLPEMLEQSKLIWKTATRPTMGWVEDGRSSAKGSEEALHFNWTGGQS